MTPIRAAAPRHARPSPGLSRKLSSTVRSIASIPAATACTLTITKSITLDCTGTFGSILASGTTGININIAVNANDPFRTVRIRGLSINGTGASGTIGTRTGIRGISILSAAVVEVEDTVISDFSLQGISDSRSTGGQALRQETR